MQSALHNVARNLPEGRMRPIVIRHIAVLAAAAICACAAPAFGQMPGGQGMGGQGMGGRPSGMSRPSEEIENTPAVDKPDAAATKAYTAGKKSLTKAKDFKSAAAAAQNPDKKSTALQKLGVGYIHLRLWAYEELIDDYNHTLALKPDLYEATFHRSEAYLATDRLENTQSAYMDLFNHARPLADRLMVSMQSWLTMHRTDAKGMRGADVEAFDKWLQERDGIAK